MNKIGRAIRGFVSRNTPLLVTALLVVALLSKGHTKTVGSSVSKKNAEASIRARYAHEKR